MAKSFTHELGERLASIEKRLNSLSSGNRLDHASLDGTTLYLKGDGQLGRIGRQPDGSNGVHVVKVQPPPQLTAAILTVGEQAGTCLVEWDGHTFDGRRMPLIHGHTEIWAELVGEDWSPTVAPGEPAKRVGTIRDRTGGEVVVALPQAGTWAVWLRAMGADRETAGPWSPVATVEIKPLVDTEAIEAELEEARDRITEADQRLTEGQETLTGHLDNLRDVRLPALDEALTTGLQNVHYEAEQMAEAARDNAVNQAAANAQSEYDRLQEIAERALSRAGDNVLEDPSFETNYHLDAWWPPRFDVSHSSQSRTGDQAMAITATGSGGTSGQSQNFGTVDVEPDDSWRFSIWYRSADGDEPNLSFGVGTRIRIRNAATNSVLAESPVFAVSDEYNRAVLTYTVPEGVDSLHATLISTHTTGTLIIDDIAFQEVGAAAEALRLAEVARQEAEAAHIAAGNAVDTAANAYDAASSKSTIHWSLSAPSGTGNPGDVWWQYETNNARRTVIGEWHWENGVWREADIAEERLPLVDIGTGTYGSLHGDRLTANTVQANALAVMPDAQDFAPRSEDLWTRDGGIFTSHTSSTTGRAVRLTNTTGQALIRGPRLPVTPGQSILIRAYSSWYGSSNIGTATHLRMEWYGSAGGDRLSSTTVISVQDGTSGHWVEGTVTVPSGVSYANFYIFQAAANGPGDRALMNFTVRTQVSGVLIEPEGIKSPQVDTNEFFAAEAVIQKIWTEIVRAKMVETEGLITEDMIATGAVTTPKLTVTEEMVAQIASFIRVEAGSLASNDIEAMRIVSSLIEATTYLIHNADGDVSVRLDGMANLIRGAIHAGVSDTAQIHLDYGPVTIQRADETSETFETAYISFDTTASTLAPRIYVDPSTGTLRISAGRNANTPPFRGRVRVAGDLGANRLDGNQLLVRGGNETTEGFDRVGGMLNSSGQVRIVGQHATSVAPEDTLVMGDAGTDARTVSSTGTYRADILYGAPSETGTRRPYVSSHVATWTHDNSRVVATTTAHRSASGFQTRTRQMSNNPSGDADFYLNYMGVWIP